MRLTIVDDSRLIELAAPRADELFPVLRRASSAAPLLAVLAFLPALVALDRSRLTEADAKWGLRSFELLSRDTSGTWSGEDILRPSDDPLIADLRWQPPLGTWLTAAVMQIIGPRRDFSLYFVSFAATVGLIGAIYGLCRTLAGARLAFWVVLFCAGSAAILSVVQEAAPHALALLCAVGTFWGYLAHMKAPDGMVSLQLLGGGISLGLCVLSGGPLAMVVVAVLLLFVLGVRGETLAGKQGKKAQKARVWTGWPALRSLLILCLTGFAVGGWWVLMMASNFGGEFWNGWIGVLTQLGGQEAWSKRVVAAFPAAERFINATGVLCGLSLAGLFHACFLIYTSNDEQERLAAHFLIAWSACGIVVWLSLLRNEAVPGHVVALWERFLAIPLIVAGAATVDRIDRRTVGFWIAAGLIAVSLGAVFVGLLTASREATRDTANEIIGWSIAFWAILGIAAWWAFRYHRTRHVVHQILLAGLVTSIVGINGCLGLASLASERPDNQSLDTLSQALALHKNSPRCTLIAADEPPLRLRYVLETTLPRARLVHVRHWDAALSQALSETRGGADTTIVVDWSARDTRPATIPIPGVGVAPIASVQSFEGRQLRTYLMTARRRP